MKKQFILISLVSALLSCRKDAQNTVPYTPESGKVNVEFILQANTYPIAYGQTFINANNDTIQLSLLKYFISNVALVSDNNLVHVQPDSYHVIDHSATGKKVITINNVPAGQYKSVRFMLGVDSARNNSGAQTGGLDPLGEAADMFWAWNTGYIMIKVEGTSPQSGSQSKYLTYHIGGFGGAYKTQRNFEIGFGNNVSVDQNKNPRVFLRTNIAEFFRSPNTINVNTHYNIVGSGSKEKMFADNYADMITLDHIQQ